jgi:capsular polysaccharide export protein
MLQGPPSLFWPELGDGFRRAGARVVKVHFCAADVVYWPRPGAVLHRGTLEAWRARMHRLVAQERVTDVIYYADRHPYHVVAREVADELGVASHVVEFGYLRPSWLTLERGGMGAYSHFPNDPDAVRAIARRVGEPDAAGPFMHAFAREAWNEVFFNLLNWVYFVAFPRYAPDRFYSPVPEYLSSFLRTYRRWRRRAAISETLSAAQSGAWPFVLYALQLQSDWQIRANAPFDDQAEPLEAAIASLARDAPADLHLVVKLHPMDVGMIDWGARIDAMACQYGVADRVHFVDGGELDVLIARSRGVLVTNSTVGLHAIRAGTPVMTFGAAIYDMEGLTHQGGLEQFWWEPDRVDRRLAADLVRALAATVQVRGSFYERGGRAHAVRTIVERILARRVNEPGAFVAPPPRLAALQRRA